MSKKYQTQNTKYFSRLSCMELLAKKKLIKCGLNYSNL